MLDHRENSIENEKNRLYRVGQKLDCFRELITLIAIAVQQCVICVKETQTRNHMQSQQNQLTLTSFVSYIYKSY